jgi:hypothetical protein
VASRHTFRRCFHLRKYGAVRDTWRCREIAYEVRSRAPYPVSLVMKYLLLTALGGVVAFGSASGIQGRFRWLITMTGILLAGGASFLQCKQERQDKDRVAAAQLFADVGIIESLPVWTQTTLGILSGPPSWVCVHDVTPLEDNGDYSDRFGGTSVHRVYCGCGEDVTSLSSPWRRIAPADSFPIYQREMLVPHEVTLEFPTGHVTKLIPRVRPEARSTRWKFDQENPYPTAEEHWKIRLLRQP